jgi:hypothetical protein
MHRTAPNKGVVPAKAGTHNHRPLLLQKAVSPRAKHEKPRRMGPRFRGDDDDCFGAALLAMTNQFTCRSLPAQ